MERASKQPDGDEDEYIMRNVTAGDSNSGGQLVNRVDNREQFPTIRISH
jgi:hypothetical protein